MVKKRTVALFMTFILLFSIIHTQNAVATSDTCFISLNEKLMELSNQALTIDSTVYVKGNIFDYFKIYYSYHAETSTASLYNSTKQLYFGLVTGNTYDNNDEYYSTSGVMRGGQVYVPLAIVCSVFNLSWSYVNGEGYGDVCRIKDGSARLTDSQFLAAASSLMQDRYNAYVRGSSSTELPIEPGSTESHAINEGARVYLSFQGLPSENILKLLLNDQVTACFFLTADDIKANPDIVRRIVGEGHSVGALCSSDPELEYKHIKELLFEAVKLETVLIASSAGNWDSICSEVAEEQGLVFCDYDINGVQAGQGISYSSLITAFLDYYWDRADVRIQCSDATDRCMDSVISYMQTGGLKVKAPSEVKST